MSDTYAKILNMPIVMVPDRPIHHIPLPQCIQSRDNQTKSTAVDIMLPGDPIVVEILKIKRRVELDDHEPFVNDDLCFTMKKKKKQPVVKDDMPSIIHSGIKCPAEIHNDEIYADLMPLMGCCAMAAFRLDFVKLDNMLEGWFPMGLGAKLYNTTHIEHGKRLFLDIFFHAWDKDAKLYLKLAIWDTVMKILTEGGGLHYMKPALVECMHGVNVRKNEKSVEAGDVMVHQVAQIAPFLVFPVLMCISMGYNGMIEDDGMYNKGKICVLDDDNLQNKQKEQVQVYSLPLFLFFLFIFSFLRCFCLILLFITLIF
jgi:hypothetical protein